MSDVKVVWKCDAAREAFEKLFKVAETEREKLIANFEAREVDAFEKSELMIQASEAYHRMLSGAYQTAVYIDLSFMNMQASLFSGGVGGES